MYDPPFRPVTFGAMDVDVTVAANGAQRVRLRAALPPPSTSLCEILHDRAAAQPDRVFLAQRGADGSWEFATYREIKQRADSIAQSLIDRNIGPDQSVMILSPNSIEFAEMMLGCLAARVPVTPVSPAYSLMSNDFSLLRHIADLVQPAMIFAQEAESYRAPIAALAIDGVEVVSVGPAEAGVTVFSDLARTSVTDAVARSISNIDPQAPAKYLFTSGSTGPPKGVINTHRMMCANLAMTRFCRPPASDEGEIAVDWLPWHHTFGGNANFNNAMNTGSTIYIDAGRPLLERFDETIRNLREVSPTVYGSVPAAFAMLAPAMEGDRELAKSFFRRLRMLVYGGAALPRDLYHRIQKLAVDTIGERIVFITGYGTTETAPSIAGTYWITESPGLLGLPMPGVELKLVPQGDVYDVRVKGPLVTPGYLRRPDLTAAAFDQDGFYITGDAARWLDENDPQQGLAFAGRIAENFKLRSGTWVQAGTLRLAAISATTPLMLDAVIAGQDEDYVALLAWLNLAAAKALVAKPEGKSTREILLDPAVVAHIRTGLGTHNAHQSGSSRRIARALLMAEPADIDAGEITDKGYINQRTTLECRRHLVDQLYVDPPGADVIVI